APGQPAPGWTATHSSEDSRAASRRTTKSTRARRTESWRRPASGRSAAPDQALGGAWGAAGRARPPGNAAPQTNSRPAKANDAPGPKSGASDESEGDAGGTIPSIHPTRAEIWVE